MTKLFVTLLAVCLFPLLIKAQTTNSFAAAKLQIEKIIATSGAETVGVAVYDTRHKQTLFINEKINFHAASTMKLPVMMELFQQAAQKKINLADSLTIKNNFFSIIDSSAYQLNKDDDSDVVLYQKIGQTISIRALIERMITRSSNLATNLLIEKAGAENVMALMKKLGANNMQVRRGVEDNKAFRAGLNNTTTAEDLMILLRTIAENKFLSTRARAEMIAILSRQEFNEGIPAGLPANTKVAHKTGSITKINHDAGIVYLPHRQPYVIVVLTRGLEDEKRAHQLIADISQTVYQTIIQTK